MAAASTTPAADETTVLDVLSGKEPIKTDVAITTNWMTVGMVVVGFAAILLVMRYFNRK